MVFFIIATERLHVQKDILQIRLIIFTDKYEKKNKKSVLQTAPPPWRNLIYINILHNCDVRFRSCREPSASHSTFAHCSAAHSHIHQYDQVTLAEVLDTLFRKMPTRCVAAGARLQYAGSKKYVTNSALNFRRLEGGI